MTVTRNVPAVRDMAQVAAPSASFIGQATAVEQARAVAEVQAAVVVAQQVPRDMGRAVADMRDACNRMGLANRAFYSVPRKGGKPVTGPSVHLARELARIFGNVQYGVHELRRDDEAGVSEIQAFAWDVERNTRSTRTFIVPHARMKTDRATSERSRERLVDLGDIYLNNQNVGARAVRECINTILPAWFTDEAEDICRHTLNSGEGVPLDDRIEGMVKGFAGIGVRVDQIEAKLGKKRSAWGPYDVAQMGIVFRSIDRGEVSKEDEFPRRVTGDDLPGAPGSAGGSGRPPTDGTSPRADVPPPASGQVGREGGGGSEVQSPSPDLDGPNFPAGAATPAGVDPWAPKDGGR